MRYGPLMRKAVLRSCRVWRHGKNEVFSILTINYITNLRNCQYVLQPSKLFESKGYPKKIFLKNYKKFFSEPPLTFKFFCVTLPLAEGGDGSKLPFPPSAYSSITQKTAMTTNNESIVFFTSGERQKQALNYGYRKFNRRQP